MARRLSTIVNDSTKTYEQKAEECLKLAASASEAREKFYTDAAQVFALLAISEQVNTLSR